jgi:hypothetical protein
VKWGIQYIQGALQKIFDAHVADGSDSVFGRCPLHVRFSPDRDQIADVSVLRFWANKRLMHCNKLGKVMRRYAGSPTGHTAFVKAAVSEDTTPTAAHCLPTSSFTPPRSSMCVARAQRSCRAAAAAAADLPAGRAARRYGSTTTAPITSSRVRTSLNNCRAGRPLSVPLRARPTDWGVIFFPGCTGLEPVKGGANGDRLRQDR